MTTAHYDIAEKISNQLPANLAVVLQQRSGAYGTVAGALETYMGCWVRDVMGAEIDQAYRALVDAIHAPREEAEKIANELIRYAKNYIM